MDQVDAEWSCDRFVLLKSRSSRGLNGSLSSRGSFGFVTGAVNVPRASY